MSFADENPLTEADLPATAARRRFHGKVAIVTGGASGKFTFLARFIIGLQLDHRKTSI